MQYVKNILSYFLYFLMQHSTAMATDLAITSPQSQTAVQPGDAMLVIVTVNNPGIKKVRLEGTLLEKASEAETALPVTYFRVEVAASKPVGNYTLKAIDVTDIKAPLPSASIAVAITSADLMQSPALQADPQRYIFTYIGQELRMNVFGQLPQGVIKLTSLVTFRILDTDIVTVAADKALIAAGAGKTSARISYGTSQISVPLTVLTHIKGDLNGNGIVEKDDIAIVHAGFTAKTHTIKDERDANGDGKIDARDEAVIRSLCTYPDCGYTGSH